MKSTFVFSGPGYDVYTCCCCDTWVKVDVTKSYSRIGNGAYWADGHAPVGARSCERYVSPDDVAAAVSASPPVGWLSEWEDNPSDPYRFDDEVSFQSLADDDCDITARMSFPFMSKDEEE